MDSPSSGLRIWTYRRNFMADGLACTLVYRAGFKGMTSVLTIAGVEHGWDFTPMTGQEAVRNHCITARLPSGRMLTVESGYYSWWNVAVAARVDDELVYESHPGTPIILPERARRMIAGQAADGQSAYDMEKLRANRVPIMVDIALGLMFFVVGKYVGLTEAALGGAAAGIVLLVIQRITRIDLLGGLASFGIIMLLLSAAFAWFFQDEEWVKQRSTIMGLIAASAFLTDGLLGGRWLGQALSRYMAYRDIVPARLSLSMGMVGLAMAGANWTVARTTSTDVWLFYTTFLDVFVAFLLALVAIQWSRQSPGGAAGANPTP
ncbi:MAG: septation protein IspZ [Sphingopyxis sp.]|nr:septation protein IspZ [Sphingopyxis sp.]